jgi:thioredoxin 1
LHQFPKTGFLHGLINASRVKNARNEKANQCLNGKVPNNEFANDSRIPARLPARRAYSSERGKTRFSVMESKSCTVDNINCHNYNEAIVLFFLMKGCKNMAEGILEIDDGNFEAEVLRSDKPVMVDFWAPWCGPCKAIGPIVEDLANSFGDQIKFTKCNVDNSPITPGKFGIKAIPTLIFFKEGDVVEQITGMVAKSKLEDAINKLL